jgi:SAM-dependent methyltransferase
VPESPPEFWGAEIGKEHWRAIRAHVRPSERVLDLGTGRGAYLPALREVGYRAVGVDQIAFPEWRSHEPGTLVQGDADRMPFVDRAFDVALAFEVLEHCPDPAAVLREIRRCTRRLLILSVPDCALDNRLRAYNLVPAHWTDRTHVQFFVERSLRELLEREGFDVLEVGRCVEVSPYRYFWDTLRVPRPIARLCRSLCRQLQLVERYWSSILVVAGVGRASP